MTEKFSLSESLSRLEILAPQAAEYMHLFIDMLHDFEDVYKERPEDVLKCFPQGFEEDQNEMIFLLAQSLERGTKESEIQPVLQSLASELKDFPVTIWALKPVFKYFSVQVGSFPEDPQQVHSMRIALPNLFCAPRDVDRFLRACGLVPEEQSGSHQKWFDGFGNFIKGFPLTSKKLWLKNIIRDLLNNRVSMEVVTTALKELKIDFKLLEK